MPFVANVGRREEIRGEFGAFVVLGRKSLNGNERDRLWRNVTGDAPAGEGGAGGASAPEFVDFGYLAGADRIEDGRAAAAIDIEGDGDLDILLQSFERDVVLLVNQGAPASRWIEARLRGTASNRDAIGARVTVEAGGRRQVREVVSTAGYLAGQSRLVHFGLGDAATIDRLVVRWPSGRETILESVAADRRLELVEPE